MNNRINIVCVKWGKKYPSLYANRLYNMVSRNMTKPFNFYCLTDNSKGLNSNINSLDINNDYLEGWWIKLMLFKEDFFGLKGHLIYMDLDVVITGNIDFLTSEFSGLQIIQNWSSNKMWNSSVMSFKLGSLSYVWKNFLNEDYNKIKKDFNGDQEWIFHCIPHAKIFDKDKIISYKKSCKSEFCKILRKFDIIIKPPKLIKCKLPYDARIVIFHGKPDPHDIMYDSWRNWKYAKFVKEHWK